MHAHESMRVLPKLVLWACIAYFNWQSVFCFETGLISQYNPYQYIYTAGGRTLGDTMFDETNAYGDGNANVWPTSPYRFSDAPYAMFGNTMYIALGRTWNGFQEIATNIAYKVSLDDVNNARWSSLPDVPGDYVAQGAAINFNNVYFAIFGGYNSDWQATNQIQVLDIPQNSWSSWDPKLPVAAGGGSVQVVNSNIYYVGNQEGNHGSEVYRAKKMFYTGSGNGDAWETLASMSEGRYHFPLLRYERDDDPSKKLIALGGWVTNGKGPTSRVAIHDIDENGAGSWSQGNDMNVNRFFHSAVWIPDTKKILVCGGYNYDYTAIDSCETYDMCNQNPSWHLLSSLQLNNPTANFAMVVTDSTPYWFARGVPCQQWYLHTTTTTTTTTTMPPCK